MKKQILFTHTAVKSVGSDSGSVAGEVTRYVELHGVAHKFFVTHGTHKVLNEHMKKPPRQYSLILEWWGDP